MNIGLLFAAILGMVLFSSALFKVVRPSEFKEAMSAYTILERAPSFVGKVASFMVPALELTSALLLANAPTRSLGALIGGGLVLTLSTVLLIDRRASIARCGCWGSMDLETPRSAYVIRNGLLLASAVGVLVMSSEPPPRFVSADAFIVLAIAAPIALLILELPNLLHIAGVMHGSTIRAR
jgi:hypothetical protein